MKIKWVNGPSAFGKYEWEVDLEDGDTPSLFTKISELRSSGFVAYGVLPLEYRIGGYKMLCKVDSIKYIKPQFDSLSIEPVSEVIE